jgi:hypothetical protein
MMRLLRPSHPRYGDHYSDRLLGWLGHLLRGGLG